MYKSIIKLISYILSYVFVIMISTNISFADDKAVFQCGETPTICGSSPLEFQNYQNFVNEMLASIQTINGEGSQLGNAFGGGGLFSNKVLQIPQANTNILNKFVSAITKGINKVISQGLASTYIMGQLGKSVVGNMVGLAVLFEGGPIMKHWKYVLDIDDQLNDMIYELGITSKYNIYVTDADTIKIQKIMDKYRTTNPIFVYANIGPKTQYKDITKLLIRINAAMKNFVSVGAIGGLTEKNAGGEDSVNVVFDIKAVTNMKNQFSCARGINNCSSATRDFAKNMKKTFDSLKNGPTDMRKRMDDANKELAIAIKGFAKKPSPSKSPGEKELSDREITLLRTVYGIDTSKITKNEGIGLRNLLKKNGTSNAFKQILDRSDVSPNDYFAEKVQESQKEEKIVINYDNITSNTLLMLNDFKTAANNIIEQHNQDLNYSLSMDPNQKLIKISEISSYIDQIKNEIGNDNKSNSIVKNLGEICEYQCENKGTEGCYAQ